MSKVIFQNANYQVVTADGDELLAPVANKILALSNTDSTKHLSLFGGSTVFKLFDYLERSGLAAQINWDNLHLWWNDERLVDHSDNESNYGELNRKYLSKLHLKAENVHPIKGLTGTDLQFENVEKETNRMISLAEKLIAKNEQGIPSFDLMILGIGDDGHTASLFPMIFDPFEPHLYVPAFHPITTQPRISQTAKLINAAKEICFIAAGEGKAQVISDVLTTISGLLALKEVIKNYGNEQKDKFNFTELVYQKLGNSQVLAYIGLDNYTTMYLDSAAASKIDLTRLEY